MTSVAAEGHYPWFEVLNPPLQGNSSTIPQESILVDLKNDTCVLVHGTGIETLQAVFNFPQYNVIDVISVNVLTKTSGDCSSTAWTWFVGSSCFSNRFRECHNTAIDKNGDFYRCRVTCLCPDFKSCESLHFKYTFALSDLYINASLCEVNLMHGDVNVPYFGTD